MNSERPAWIDQRLKSAIELSMRETGGSPNVAEVARSTGLGKSVVRRYLRMIEDRAAPKQEIVAGVITDGRRFGLVRRSMSVSSDRGLWHCVTGFLEGSSSPRKQILEELHEELGLREDQIVRLLQTASLSIVDEETHWLVHVFLVETGVTDFDLNWENDDFCWIHPGEIQRDVVSWLKHVLAAVQLDI